MRVHLLTLSFSSALGRFDDAPLQALLTRVDLVALREHFFVVADVPHLLCVVQCTDAATGSPAAASAPAEPEPIAPADQALFERLRAWRAAIAHDEGVPAYVVLTNRQLRAVVATRPGSLAALRTIDGIGEKKVARHGAALLAALHEAAPAEGEPAEAAS
jgi:superfamily II DNA helicase RecQ